MKKLMTLTICAALVFSSCGTVNNTPNAQSLSSNFNSDSKASETISRIFTTDSNLSKIITLLEKSNIDINSDKAIVKVNGNLTSALVPTSSPEYYLFVEDIYSPNVASNLLKLSQDSSGRNTLSTTYLADGLVVTTTTDVDGKLISSSVGNQINSTSLYGLTQVGSQLFAQDTPACASARQALVSANLTLASATIAFGAALASCAVITPLGCAAAVLATQLALGAAGANVNSARLNVQANCA